MAVNRQVPAKEAMTVSVSLSKLRQRNQFSQFLA